MKCFNCNEPADYVPRVKLEPGRWSVYGELACCELCLPKAAAEVAERAGSGHATQMIPYPETPYQLEAARNPNAHAARIRARRMKRPPMV